MKNKQPATQLEVKKLSDQSLLKRARIHPLAVLIAQKVYAQGRGEKGSLVWQPVSKIVDALDQAFYATWPGSALKPLPPPAAPRPPPPADAMANSLVTKRWPAPERLLKRRIALYLPIWRMGLGTTRLLWPRQSEWRPKPGSWAVR